MLTMLTIGGLALALAAGVFLLLAVRRPDSFSYSRSVVIDAPPDRIFPFVADPVAFNAWNPFNEDPSIAGSYSGPSRGPGARYTFASRRAGTGYTEIVEERAPTQLVVRLVMTKPMACDNRVDFHLEPVAGGTRVTWSMSGRMSFPGKVMNQVIDCERMCADQFTRGLNKLKSIAEEQKTVVA